MSPLRSVSLVLSVLAVAAGAVGMPMSFLYLASSSLADITAGAAGFVAGAVLIAAGVVALAVLAAREPGPFPRQIPTFGSRSGTDITA